MIPGIHWRNVNPMEEDAFEIADQGHFGAFVIMSNAGPELPREIRRRFPDALIIVRLYWPAGDLPSHGEAFGKWLEYMDAVGNAVTHYQILNETDLEYPNVTPERFAEWFMVAQGGLKSQHPNKRYGFPMPSVRGQAAMDYIYRCGEAIAQADWIAEHCYWQEAWQMDDRYWGSRYYSVHESWPGKELHITEFGCSAELDADTRATAYRAYLRTLPEYVKSASVFWMAGGDGWPQLWVDSEMGKGITRPSALTPVEKIEEGNQLSAYVIGEGIKAEIEKRGEQPLEDEHYLWPNLYSICASDKALYVYSFKANQVYRLPVA